VSNPKSAMVLLMRVPLIFWMIFSQIFQLLMTLWLLLKFQSLMLQKLLNHSLMIIILIQLMN